MYCMYILVHLDIHTHIHIYMYMKVYNGIIVIIPGIHKEYVCIRIYIYNVYNIYIYA